MPFLAKRRRLVSACEIIPLSLCVSEVAVTLRGRDTGPSLQRRAVPKHGGLDRVWKHERSDDGIMKNDV